MWMVLQVLGGALGGQPASKLTQGNKRRKLQKPARDKREDIVEDCELLSSPVSLSVSLDHRSDEVMTAEAAKRETRNPQPRDITDIATAIRGNEPQTPLADPDLLNSSVNSLSIYSFDDMAIEILKRTRAKTPCFWVGQLDRHPFDDNRYDSAIALACEYQAVLPPRTFTPCLEPEPLGRTIRKVKGRQSLREIVERDESMDESRDSVYSNAQCNDNYNYHHNLNHNHNYTSDCDTLVGSDSPASPTTPRSGYFPRPKSPLFPFAIDAKPYPHSRDSCLEDRTSVGFQICLDLLTEQLARGLFKKHPAEHLDRASGLQIQLMIEAYESVLQHIRGETTAIHITDLRLGHLAEIEQTLDHWIQALYSVYDRTRTKSNGSTASFRSCRSSFSSSITLQSSPADE